MSTPILRTRWDFMLNYTKLWLLLDKRGMKRTDLTKNKVISPNTLAKLGKNEPISSTVIEKICDYLECQPADMMENIKREDAIKLGETVNEQIANMMQLLTVTTGMSPEAMFAEFQKELPDIMERWKNGDFDFVGINKLKEDNK